MQFFEWLKKEVRFSTGQKSHHIVIRCTTISWLCDLGYFSWGDQQESQNRTRIWTPRYEECSTSGWAIKRNALPPGELRKGWTRHVLGKCTRAFLVAGPARSSRSHGTWAACDGRSQEKKRVIVLIVSSDSSPRGDGFVLPSAASCRWAATTHPMATKVIPSLMLSLSVLVDARVLRPVFICLQLFTLRKDQIDHDLDNLDPNLPSWDAVHDLCNTDPT